VRVRGIVLLTLLVLPVWRVVAQFPAPPPPAREFRGAWIATVRGIDFPHNPNETPAQHQAELRAIIEKASAIGINALLFQVRPMGDAFYKSKLEPWSPWLTGQMGAAPNPLWDPLEFAIKEAHARGIELHAWFNPYRALAGNQFAAGGNHILIEHPEWCVHYGGDVWMDPGEPGVRARTEAVIMDVVRRYDVDGIHMDDYFYPYPAGKKEFPDDRTWNAYRKAGGTMDRKAWRRANVDTLVQELYGSIKKEKAAVRFGISPFGIWRPGYPEGTGKGALDAYDALAADSLRWLREGWCDYMAPQLYWRTDQENLAFGRLFDWWLSGNASHRHVWPGIATERVLSDRQASEILREISITRLRGLYMPPGHIHWDMGALMKNRGLVTDVVRERAYQQLAVVPPALWLGAGNPPQPIVAPSVNGVPSWTTQDPRLEALDVRWWLVQVYLGNEWISRRLLPVGTKQYLPEKECRAMAVRAVSPSGLTGDPLVIRLR